MKQVITLCPECREYLPEIGNYTYCVYCGAEVRGREYIKETIDTVDEDIGNIIRPEKGRRDEENRNNT